MFSFFFFLPIRRNYPQVHSIQDERVTAPTGKNTNTTLVCTVSWLATLDGNKGVRFTSILVVVVVVVVVVAAAAAVGTENATNVIEMACRRNAHICSDYF